MRHKITGQQYNSRKCFVCGLDNLFGLQARFYETENKELVAVFSTLEGHQSYPNRLHGGVSSAILDETIGRAITIHHGSQVWGVTMELNTRFLKPVPLGVELKAVGRITLERGRFFEGTGELLLPNGEVAVKASGKYFKMTVEEIAGGEFVEKEWGLLPEETIPSEIDY